MGFECWLGHDGGETWKPVGNEFVDDGVTGTHQWYDGTPHPWEFARVWLFAAISAAGVFRSDDAGKTWRPANRGLRSEGIPDPEAKVGHCVHRLVMHPSRPGVLLDALEAPYPVLRGAIRDRARRSSAGRWCASSPASWICLRNRRTPRCPLRSPRAPSPSWSSEPWLAAERAPSAMS